MRIQNLKAVPNLFQLGDFITISFFPLVQVKKGTKSEKSKKLGVDRQKAGSGTC